MPDGNTPDKPKAPSVEEVEGQKSNLEITQDGRQKAKNLLEAISPEEFKNRVMQLAAEQGWLDEDGNSVGIVNHNGESIQSEIEDLLLQTSFLLKFDRIEALADEMKIVLEKAVARVDEEVTQQRNDDMEKLMEDLEIMKDTPDEVRERLQERMAGLKQMMEPSAVGAIKGYIDFFEQKMDEIITKMSHPNSGPAYAVEFSRGGGVFREDVRELMAGLITGQQHASGLADHYRSRPEFRHFKSSGPKRLEIVARNAEHGIDVKVSEFDARLEINQELGAEIVELAGQGACADEITERMPAMLSDQLDLLCNCTANQRYNSFVNPRLELGETDAESLQLIIETFNQFLKALHHIRRSKVLIPQFK